MLAVIGTVGRGVELKNNKHKFHKYATGFGCWYNLFSNIYDF